LEIDLVLEKGADVMLVEIKSSQTPSGHSFSSLERFTGMLAGREAPRIALRVVVYGGEESQRRSQGELLSWRDIASFDWIDPEPRPGLS
jgi:hypothetical protein